MGWAKRIGALLLAAMVAAAPTARAQQTPLPPDVFNVNPRGGGDDTRPYVSPDGRSFDRCAYERDHPGPDTRAYGPPDRVPIGQISSQEARQRYIRCAVDPCAPNVTAQCWRRPGSDDQTATPAPRPGPLEGQAQVLQVAIPQAFSIFVPGLQNIADQVNFLSTYHPLKTFYVGLAIAGGGLATLPANEVAVLQAANNGAEGTLFRGNAAAIDIKDAAVSRTAPAVRPLDRPIGTSANQNQVMQEDRLALEKLGAGDFRVNQQQVDLNNNRVGINRPDLQFTYLGRRYHIEYDRPPPIRAADHGARLYANDPNAIIIFKTIP
jgi:hypothetical protein